MPQAEQAVGQAIRGLAAAAAVARCGCSGARGLDAYTTLIYLPVYLASYFLPMYLCVYRSTYLSTHECI